MLHTKFLNDNDGLTDGLIGGENVATYNGMGSADGTTTLTWAGAASATGVAV